MQWFYLIGILLSITGMALLDYRYKLAYFHDAKRTVMTVVAALFIFILWDFFGIFLGIFKHGDSPYQLPFTLAPHFPLEEIFFLCLLSYCTLVIYNGVSKWRSRI